MLKIVNSMKRFIFSYAMFTCSLTFFCSAKNTDIRGLDDFEQLEVSNGVSVSLQVGGKSKKIEASIEVDGVDTKDLKTQVKGDGLLVVTLKQKPSKFDPNNKSKKQKAKVLIPCIGLARLKVKGASSLVMDDDQGHIKCEELEVITETAAKVNASVKGEVLSISAKSGSKIKLTGEASDVKIEAAGGASVDVTELDAKTCEISAATGATVKVGSVKKSVKVVSVTGAKVVLTEIPDDAEFSRGSLGIIKVS